MHRTETRKFIKRSLWEFSEHVAAEKIHVKDLVSFAGMSRTVFYRNFGSLSDVWHSIGHDVLNEIALTQREFTSSSGQGLRENLLQNVADCIYHEKDKIQIIAGEWGDPIFIPKFEKQTRSWILRCLGASGNWEADPQQEQMAFFLTPGGGTFRFGRCAGKQLE